jgi:phage gp29-like protein
LNEELDTVDMTAPERDAEEHADLVQLAVELRELLFDDANGVMQGAMVGSPVECVAFAKWWIQRQKGLRPDQEWFEVANENEITGLRPGEGETPNERP